MNNYTPSHFWHWLTTPPVYAKQHENLTARLLNFILLVALGLTAVLSIIFRQVKPDDILGIILTLLMTVAIIAAKLALHRYRLQLASIILLLVGWLTATVGIGRSGALNAPTFNLLLWHVFIAVLLLKPRASLFISTLVLASALILAYGYAYDLLPPRTINPNATHVWLIYALVVAVVTLNLALVARWLVQSQTERHLYEEELLRSHAEIQRQIEEKQQSEMALKRSEELYRRLFSHAPLGIFHFDQHGVIVDCNDLFVRIIGSSREKLIGMNMLKSLHDKVMVAAIVETIERGAGYYEGNYQSVTAVKTTPVRVILTRLNTSQEPSGDCMGIVEDVTERQQAEEALRQAQKLESLGVLAGGIAHDFNNLLVAMLGQTSLALTRLPPQHPARLPVERSVLAAEQAAELTHQLLVYSGRGQFQSGPIDLNYLIEDNLHLFRVALPRHVSFHLNLQKPLLEIEGDRGQLQQVIMNLLLNAAESIALPGGEVTMTTEMKQRLPGDNGHFWPTGTPLPSGEYVLLTVQDTGAGMDEATLGKIFDPFFTTKFTGRGLGLAAVLGIVQAHRGGLQVKSEIGRGTTFHLLFPISPLQNTTSRPLPAPKSNLPTLTGLILIIDDEEPVRLAVTDILEMYGLEVITAVNGQQGCVLFRQHHQELRLVLLDLSMPGMSGEETFAELQAIDAQVPIVLSSGYSQIEVTERFPLSHKVAFLQKPFSSDTLIRSIAKYLT